MSSIISKVCLYAPAIFHLLHGGYFFGDPLGLFATVSGVQRTEIGEYLGGDQFKSVLELSCRESAIFEVITGLGLLYLGDSRMGHMLLIFFHVLSASFDAELGHKAAFDTLTATHKEGFETGRYALTVMAAISILGFAVTKSKKSDVQRRNNVLSDLILFIVMMSTAVGGLLALLFPTEGIAMLYSFLGMDLTNASSALRVVLQYQWKSFAAAALVFSLIVGSVKPANFALFLVIVCDCMCAFTTFEMIRSFPGVKDQLEMAMMGFGACAALCFITIFTLPSAKKTDKLKTQ